MSTITAGKVVHLRYNMKTPQGQVLDQTGDTPEGYVHGHGAIVPGLERALEGRRVGDRFQVTLAPADGFGLQKKSAGAQPVPRATFPPEADLKPGIKFSAETPDGSPVTLYICRVAEDVVYVDTNHPFAGQTLEYDVEVVSIRNATADEKRDGVVTE